VADSGFYEIEPTVGGGFVRLKYHVSAGGGWGGGLFERFSSKYYVNGIFYGYTSLFGDVFCPLDTSVNGPSVAVRIAFVVCSECHFIILMKKAFSTQPEAKPFFRAWPIHAPRPV
jgi:hypothetical protein